MASIRLTEEKATNLQGRLEDFPLADILQVLQASGKSGVLLLTRSGSTSGIVVFREGQIVQAIANDSRQTLGDRLVSKGAITPSGIRDALAYQARYPGMRVGDALVELGLTTREEVETEVKEQMAETIERMMEWNDAQFEFRIGAVSLSRGLPDFTEDLILDEGVEPRDILLEAALLQDKRSREAVAAEARSAEAVAAKETEPVSGGRELLDTRRGRHGAEGETPAHWFDPRVGGAIDLPETARHDAALKFLSLAEELFIARGRGEIGLLLLRYASELYSDGGLVIREKTMGRDRFRLLGQFGHGFGLGPRPGQEPKTSFAQDESPLLDLIARDGRAYAGHVVLTSQGGLTTTETPVAGSVPVLAVPLLVLDSVSLILVCRTSVTAGADARPLLVLARQVSMTFENLLLRELARRTAQRRHEQSSDRLASVA